MKKLICITLTAILVLGITVAAFAGPTVSSAMYGDDKAASTSLTTTEVEQKLIEAGVRDVQSTSWAAGPIAILVGQGLMAPSTDGYFKPAEKVSAVAGVAVFAKVLGIAAKGDTVEAAFNKAKESGLTEGTSKGDMTRMEVARMLVKALNVTPKPIDDAGFSQMVTDAGGLSESDKSILAALYELGIFRGYPDKTFGPQNVLTNAEIAALVDRLIGTKQ